MDIFIMLFMLAILWVAGAFVVGSFLMWWFNTSLPVHVLEIVRWLGYKKHDNEFWGVSIDIGGGATFVTPLEDFTTSDTTAWMEAHWHPKLVELFTCPGCLSAHVSWWVAVALQFCIWEFNPVFFLACWLAWPSAGNIILKQTQK